MAYDLLRRRPTPVRFTYALFNCSIAFFLFSYQVHEKGILMPLLLSGCLVGVDPFASALFTVVSTFSMSPLLVRDGLSVLTLCAYSYILAHLRLHFNANSNAKSTSPTAIVAKLFAVLALALMATLHILHAYIPPPTRYPHLWIVLIETFSSGVFIMAAVYGNVMQWTSAKRKMD